MRTLVVAILAGLLLAGCGEVSVTPPRDNGVDVTTPALQAQKQRTTVPDCPSTNNTTTTAADTDSTTAGGLPATTLPCLGGGRAVDLAKLRGPLVINLWASWCTNCPKELPVYQAFARKYAGKVAVLGVDWQDTDPAAALDLAARKKLSYPQLADPVGKIAARGLPKLILVDAQGKVVFDEPVLIPDLATLERLAQEHLGEQTLR